MPDKRTQTVEAFRADLHGTVSFAEPLAQQVSFAGVPATPSTHSVSTPGGTSSCGETISSGRIVRAVVALSTAFARSIGPSHCIAVPG